MKNSHVGSSFDDFLEDQNILKEVTALAMKRAIARQMHVLIGSQKISKSQLAAKMRTSRAALDRMLDEDDTSTTLSSIAAAAAALRCTPIINLVDPSVGVSTAVAQMQYDDGYAQMKIDDAGVQITGGAHAAA